MDMEHLFDEVDAPSDDQLKTISTLAQRQRELLKKLAEIEKVQKSLTADLRKIQEKDLPEAMEAANMKKFTLGDGSSIAIREGITASLSEERREAACQWLRENGYGDIVKEDIAVSFGKGEGEQAAAAAALLTAHGFSTARQTNVHTATLKALIREELSKGKEMPLELLGAYRWTKAEIK